MSGEKTEAPTPKRRQKAEEDGNVLRSRDLATALVVLAGVACDPAALARDVAVLAELGYRLDRLRAFDLFPQTHHVEAVARFARA